MKTNKRNKIEKKVLITAWIFMCGVQLMLTLRPQTYSNRYIFIVYMILMWCFGIFALIKYKTQ